MVGGAAVNFGLPYVFERANAGDAHLAQSFYGQYIDLGNTLSILSMVLVTGGIQTLSRFVAPRPDEAGGVIRQALRMMGLLGLLSGGAFILAAPWIASARGDAELTMGYRAAGLILIAYAFYTVFIGALNGRKLFYRQALYDIGFTSLKTTLVLGMALLGLGVNGAFSGFALAAITICLLAVWRVGPQIGRGPQEPGLWAFAFKVMAYTLVFNLVFKLDILLAKPIAQSLFAQAGAGAEQAADALMGQYGLALNLSRIPWQATIAITFVVFPLMSEATFHADIDRTRTYIRQTLRYTMLLVALPAVVLSALPGAPIALLPAQYAPAALALAWLAPAYFVFSLFNVVNTLLMSAGRAGLALIVGLVGIGGAALLYQLWLPGAVDGPDLLVRAGQATLVAFLIGLSAGLIALQRLYGSPIVWPSALRVVLIGAALVAAGQWLPPLGKLVGLVAAAGVALLFFVGLLLTGEFNAEDRARLAKVLGKRAKSADA